MFSLMEIAFGKNAFTFHYMERGRQGYRISHDDLFIHTSVVRVMSIILKL